MKYPFFIGAVIALVVFLSFKDYSSKNAVSETPVEEGKGFALVELFTSEGCSSCPAADAEVEKIAKEYSGRVFVLGFHVDYWNRLGWKDEYSDAKYSARQREYAGRFKLSSVYTPQVVVNGKYELVGSDDTKLNEVVGEALKTSQDIELEVLAVAVTSHSVRVSYKLPAKKGNTLNIALVQLQANTNVRSGENGGNKLHHINIVRSFQTISDPPTNGTGIVTIPADLNVNECNVIVFAQHGRNGNVSAVRSVSIQ